jgi:hypothetical protein
MIRCQVDGSSKPSVDKLPRVSDSDEDQLPLLDFSAGNKDACVLEVRFTFFHLHGFYII